MIDLTTLQVSSEEPLTAGILSIPAVNLVIYSVLVLLIIYVLWLSNRHIKKSHSKIETSDKLIKIEQISLERKLSERTIAFMQAEEQKMIELERNAEFGKLSQGLFHDLISPLSTVSLYVQSLKKEINQSKETDEAIKAVVNSSQRMNSFIESVRRSLGNIGAQSKEIQNKSADLEKEIGIVRDILGYKARMIGVKIDINQPEKIILPIHPIRLHQLILNLVSNAIEACNHTTNATNVVTIKAIKKKTDAKNLIELSVRDNGCGISPENLAKVFKKPFTTKKDGNGIGLMTIKNIVENDLGGTIEVESREGRGTEFVVRISE